MSPFTTKGHETLRPVIASALSRVSGGMRVAHFKKACANTPIIRDNLRESALPIMWGVSDAEKLVTRIFADMRGLLARCRARGDLEKKFYSIVFVTFRGKKT